MGNDAKTRRDESRGELRPRKCFEECAASADFSISVNMNVTLVIRLQFNITFIVTSREVLL